MKTRTAEMLCRKHASFRPVFYRWLKRYTAKKWRRAAKVDPENAPVRRPIKGYCD